MAGSAVLTGLLRQLGRAASPLERMKLLAMSWRALRQMSPAEREQLAQAVGMDEAHELVEQIADPKVGLSPSKLLVALQQTDENDVSRLRSFLGNVRTREGRKKLFTQGVDTLTKRLEKEETRAEQQPQAQQGQVVATPPQIKPAPVHLQAQPASKQAAPAEPLAPQSEWEQPVPGPAAPQKKAAAVAAAGAVAAAATAQKAAKPAAPAKPAPKATPKAPAVQAAPTPKPPAAKAKQTTKPKPTPVAKPVEAAKAPRPRLEQTGKGLLVKVRACDTVSEKFRLLRTRRDLLRYLSWPQIRELCETFPEGWSRRRAVDLVLKGSVLKNLTGLKDLLELLPEGKDRDWVLAGLIRARQLTPKDMSHLGELSLSPRLQRLLARQAVKKSA